MGESNVCFSHIIGIALPANLMSDCGLSPLSTRPCTQDQAAGKCVQLLPGLGRERGWLADLCRQSSKGPWSDLGKSQSPGGNGVSEKTGDWFWS